MTASVEMHLMGCGHCRGALTPLVDPAPLREVWDRVADELQAPRPHQDRAGRCPARAHRPRRPAGRGGTGAARVLAARAAALPALLRHRGDPGEDRGGLAFLCIAPLLPVGAVAFAYGQEADPIWEITLAAPYPPLRLLLLRAVSVVVVALPLAFVAAPVLPGPPWMAGAWLLPAFACAAFTPRPLHLDLGPARRRCHLVGVGRRGRSGRRTRTGHAVAVLAAPVLPVYLAIGLVAAVTFWMRSDRLSLLRRTS